jgi:multiple sugar transport system ATP-binding protein
MSSIAFEGVTKVYRDGTVAVRDLDLVVRDGELFVLLGASGSGKTTILRLVAGLDGTTEGRILLDEEDVTDRPPPKRDVAMVFQHLALYPHLDVYDNIAFGVRMRRLHKSEVDARVRRASAILGLDDVLKKRPKRLSGGQAQRVALGRAIVREPRAFLMDEPLSSLDERLRAQLRQEFARIQREVGVTTLYVTHDQSEAMLLGDRVGVLRDGILQQVEEPRRVYERPDNLFVAAFVGSPPMNLAQATLDEREGGGVAVIFGGHRVRVDVETASRRPDLADYIRRQIVIGIRPEHLLPASEIGAPDDARFRAEIERGDVTGDGFARFVVDAPTGLHDAKTELGRDGHDAGDDEPASLTAGPNVWTARVPAASAGDVVELAFEQGRLHAFDPRTGAPIGG